VNVAEHYTYRVAWSAEDGSFVGTVAELPSLSWLAETRGEAFEGIQRLVAEVIHDLEANGEPVPEALADRTYSGQFVVRVPPEVHRQLVLDAAEQHVSLNRLVSSRLAS
jgi:predicted HicB family RNase H-like nuclease